MRFRTLSVVGVVASVALSAPLHAQQQTLNSGYILCQEADGLLAFIEPDIGDLLFSDDPPDSVRIYPEGFPGKTARIRIDGEVDTVPEGRKLLEGYDCRATDGIEYMTVQHMGECYAGIPPLPNGGCLRVRLPRVDPPNWYTFADAIPSREAAAMDSVRVVTPGGRARLCLVPNCGPQQHTDRLPTGAVLPILDSRQVRSGAVTNRWYLVRYGGGQGWVSEHDVKRVN